MSSIQKLNITSGQPAAGTAPSLSARTLLLLAAAAGCSVASIYYSQPMLGTLAGELHTGEGAAGLVPTLTQLGYALGILLLAPLGDRYDRRRIILAKVGLLAATLLASGLAPGIAALLAASLAVGLAATVTQDLVPAAATLAPAAERGRVVGTVMTGLLLGILLSRVVSGLVAQWLGWRMVYLGAAAAVLLIGLALWRGLPRFAPTTRLGYRALMATMLALLRQHPALRRAALAQGLLAIGFSAFWSMLAVMLHQQLQLGSAAAGAFGLAGAAGALAAPLAGRLADRRSPEIITRLGAAMAAASFALLALDGWLPTDHARLALLLACAVGLDFGVQAALVAHQTIVYGLDPDARSRLNAILFTGMFAGMSAGAALGGLIMGLWGWIGVAALATLTSLAALLVRLQGR